VATRRITPRRVLAALIAIALIVAMFALPIRAWSVEIVTWIRDSGPLAVGLFVVVYVGAAVLAVPGSVLTLGAGFAYGPLWGTMVVSPASVLAASVAFAIARRFGRGWIARRFEGDRRFEAIDRAIARQGFKITALLRLSPVVPYSLLNYMLGLTNVRFRHYVVGSALGMLPGTIVYVYLGSLVTTTTQLGTRPTSGWTTTLYWAGLASAVVVLVLITRSARRSLARELGPDEVSRT
jgi:uncharacterized membrane protein YdjX (TVP38/TMEM64 family)